MEQKGAETLTSGLDTIRAVRAAPESAGVEFMNGYQPEARTKKDAGEQLARVALSPDLPVGARVRYRRPDGEPPEIGGPLGISIVCRPPMGNFGFPGIAWVQFPNGPRRRVGRKFLDVISPDQLNASNDE
jgi:hypothetical protein